MKIKEVIEKIIAWHQPCKVRENTRDQVLCGDADEECTGVVVTICATMEVMQKAVAAGCNFIISHEGIYYGYEKVYDVNAVENETLQQKIAFAKAHHLTVWRDHDHMHGQGRLDSERIREDMIYYGTMKELGWEPYLIKTEKKPLWFKIPKQSARQLGAQLMEKWNLNGLRLVGNPDAEIETVYIIEHVNGSEREIEKLDMAQQADAIIPLEIVDFTVTQYVRDCATLGKNKVILEMGHFNAEELGMKYLEKVLPDVLDNEVPVKFIQGGDTFSYLLRQ